MRLAGHQSRRAALVMTKEQLTVRGPVASLVQAVSTPSADTAPVRTSMVNWRTQYESDGHCTHWEILVSLPS